MRRKAVNGRPGGRPLTPSAIQEGSAGGESFVAVRRIWRSQPAGEVAANRFPVLPVSFYRFSPDVTTPQSERMALFGGFASSSPTTL